MQKYTTRSVESTMHVHTYMVALLQETFHYNVVNHFYIDNIINYHFYPTVGVNQALSMIRALKYNKETERCKNNLNIAMIYHHINLTRYN